MSFIPNDIIDSALDEACIPNVIYSITIEKNTEAVQNYFILHTAFMYSFVGFNSILKLANQLAIERKCSCYYYMPWITYYQAQNNTKKTVLTFAQQVNLYRYMISHWYPYQGISYMHWLSNIALGMIQDIGVFNYNRSNNLQSCNIFQKNYYKNNFPSERAFILYLESKLPLITANT